MVNEGRNSNQETKRKWLLLSNDLMDCLLIDELFEKEMTLGQKYEDQKYFQKMRNLDIRKLEEFYNLKVNRINGKGQAYGII